MGVVRARPLSMRKLGDEVGPWVNFGGLSRLRNEKVFGGGGARRLGGECLTWGPAWRLYVAPSGGASGAARALSGLVNPPLGQPIWICLVVGGCGHVYVSEHAVCRRPMESLGTRPVRINPVGMALPTATPDATPIRSTSGPAPRPARRPSTRPFGTPTPIPLPIRPTFRHARGWSRDQPCPRRGRRGRLTPRASRCALALRRFPQLPPPANWPPAPPPAARRLAQDPPQGPQAHRRRPPPQRQRTMDLQARGCPRGGYTGCGPSHRRGHPCRASPSAVRHPPPPTQRTAAALASHKVPWHRTAGPGSPLHRLTDPVWTTNHRATVSGATFCPWGGFLYGDGPCTTLDYGKTGRRGRTLGEFEGTWSFGGRNLPTCCSRPRATPVPSTLPRTRSLSPPAPTKPTGAAPRLEPSPGTSCVWTPTGQPPRPSASASLPELEGAAHAYPLPPRASEASPWPRSRWPPITPSQPVEDGMCGT
jgi:hypothetical protein